MRNTVKIIIFVIFFFIIGVFYISLTRETNYSTLSLINKEVPQFKIEYFEKNGFYSKQDLIQNNYTLINFWASWCGPCKIEHPILMKLSAESNLKILGVNFKDKKDLARKFLKDFGNPYSFLLKDIEGKQSISFGIYGIPESLLINNENIIIKKFVGPLSHDNYKEIKEMIN
ncbi:DsbE family thiol:disulfide interchange protein [Candidatus Pelagibacter bacterium]|nr:DsbE family thiol:disulfide interchange protein [Candidatus Pelagibacter bacterium]